MVATKTIQIPATLHADIVELKDKEGAKLHLNRMTITAYLTRLIEQQKQMVESPDLIQHLADNM